MTTPSSWTTTSRRATRTELRSATPWRTTTLGGFFLAMSGIHVGILSADPTTYAPFAEQALFPFVRDGWSHVFMAHPRFWALLLAAGEATIGTCLLVGGRAARTGWVLAIAFHVLLMLFGFGIWMYAIPALYVLVRASRHDWRGLRADALIPSPVPVQESTRSA